MLKKILISAVTGVSLMVATILGSSSSETARPFSADPPPSMETVPDGFAWETLEASDGETADLRQPVIVSTPAPIKYGINFISDAADPADSNRYALARTTGAKWNRQPMYWHEIEQSSGSYDWSRHDPVIANDTSEGFLINAILMGIPGFYFDGSRAVPNTLWEPVFSDGTDFPGDGKTININNKWAQYVFHTVERYKPGGVLAQAEGWQNGAGIRQWEIWNEPDLPDFWDGTKEEYARLLKVAHLTVHTADPSAQVISGAMANNYNDTHYYRDVLAILDADPMAEDNNHFHEIMATHSYFYAWGSWYHVFRAKNAMEDVGINKPIWLNEYGVPAWNDYPGPVWDQNSPYRATMQESADYMIQSAFYSVYAGAEGLFFFQMFDGCGNQPQNTTFPPHNGELCDANGMLTYNSSIPCAGDAYGLFRNTPGMSCFREHPQPGTPRPVVDAHEMVSQYLQDVRPLARYKVCANEGQSWIAFYRPNTNQRILAVWACTDQPQQARVPAIGNGAELIRVDGSTQFISPASDGRYYLDLAGATNDQPIIEQNRWPIGGRPLILVERDLQSPTAEINGSEQANGISVNWSGDDLTGSGIAAYTVRVSVDGGEQTVWLSETRETSGVYTGNYEYGVEFFVTAEDYGGNTSSSESVLVGTPPPVKPPFVALTANKRLVRPNEAVTFKIYLRNDANRENWAVQAVDVVPDSLRLLPDSVTYSSGDIEIDGNTLIWRGGILANRDVEVTFRTQVITNPSESTAILNGIEVTDGSGNVVGDSAEITVLIVESQLYLPLLSDN